MSQAPIISIGGKVKIAGKDAVVTNITKNRMIHAVDVDGKTHKLTLKEAETL